MFNKGVRTEFIRDPRADDLIEAVKEWTESIDNLMIINDCNVEDLIGDKAGQLGRIYKAFKEM